MLPHLYLLPALASLASALPAGDGAELSKRAPLLGITLPEINLLGCNINYKLVGGLCNPVVTCTGKTYLDTKTNKCVPCADPDALTCNEKGATKCETKWLLNGVCSDCNRNDGLHRQESSSGDRTCLDCLGQGMYYMEETGTCVKRPSMARILERDNTHTGGVIKSATTGFNYGPECGQWCIDNVPSSQLKLIQYTQNPSRLCECIDNINPWDQSFRGSYGSYSYRFERCENSDWAGKGCDMVALVGRRCFQEGTEKECGER